MDRFYRIEYTGRIKRTGKVFDTTDKEIAEENGIYNEKIEYGPKDITSEDELIEGVTENLEEMKEGEEKEFIIPPEKAYGKRDPSKVDMVPTKDFEDTDVTPMPGLHVILDGKPAKIQTVSGGRVRVDFNNPLAGKKLKYKLKVKKIFEEDLSKSRIIIKENLPVDEEEIEAEENKEEKSLKVKLPAGTFSEDEEEIKKVKEKIKEETNYEKIGIKEKTIDEEEEEKNQ
ncbi:MAG: FKBP-type peptidyl-prolyl cis-trans isomerase [archaeon]